MIEVEERGKKRKVSGVKDVASLFKKMNLNIEEYVVVVNGKIVLEDEKLEKEDKVKLYPVVSGG